MLLLDLVGELVAPSRCAACDVPVGPRALFCTVCAASVERAPDGTFEYGGAISIALLRLKYSGRADLAARIAGVLPLPDRIDTVVPVPLHPRRLAERGYNQAALLAAPIARRLGARFAPRALARIRDTPNQARLDRAGRIVNVEGAFVQRQPLAGRVLLVDDVMTTGATLAACRRAIATSVTVLVVARRP